MDSVRIAVVNMRYLVFFAKNKNKKQKYCNIRVYEKFRRHYKYNHDNFALNRDKQTRDCASVAVTATGLLLYCTGHTRFEKVREAQKERKLETETMQDKVHQ